MTRMDVLALALLVSLLAVSCVLASSDAAASSVPFAQPAAAAAAAAAGLDPFDLWLRSHPRSYVDAAEYSARRTIFRANLAKIADHNLHRAARGLTYTLALNSYADLSFDEFRSRKMGANHKHRAKRLAHTWNSTEQQEQQQQQQQQQPASRLFTPPTAAAASAASPADPTNLDWRLLNAVTPIKNQEGCSADYAFAAIAALEGAHAIATKALQVLSEQQIVDCSIPQGNQACEDGTVASSFQYLIDATNDKTVGGAALDSLYPYANEAQTCGSPPTTGVAPMIKQVDLPQGDESALLSAVNVGPVAVYVDSSQEAWQFYSLGILNDPSCGVAVDHSVAVVGYGLDAPTNSVYWIVKNSWGQGWGEDGYARLARGINQCGIGTKMTYPVV